MNTGSGKNMNWFWKKWFTMMGYWIYPVVVKTLEMNIK